MILGKSYLGATEVSKVYLGATQVYPTAPVGVELYTWTDAGSPSVTDDGTLFYDASPLTGWGNSTRCTKTPIQYDTYIGSWAVEINSTQDGSSNYALFWWQGIIGKTYKISVRAKRGVGVTQYMKTAAGFTTPSANINITTNVWDVYEYEGVCDAVSRAVYFYCNSPSGFTGDTLLLDNVSILQID